MRVSINMHANTHCEVLVCIALQWVLLYILIDINMLLPLYMQTMLSCIYMQRERGCALPRATFT